MKLFTVVAAIPIALSAWCAQAASPVVVDANGVILGFYQGPNTADAGATVVVITTQGYVARYDRVSGVMSFEPPDAWTQFTYGRIQALYFESADCSGDPYIPVSESFTGGTVAAQQESGDRYYIPKNSGEVTLVNLSRRLQNGQCQSGQTASGTLMRVYPNDPNVTGVQNEPAVGPLRIEVVTIGGSSFDVFKDGFEPIPIPA